MVRVSLIPWPNSLKSFSNYESGCEEPKQERFGHGAISATAGSNRSEGSFLPFSAIDGGCTANHNSFNCFEIELRLSSMIDRRMLLVLCAVPLGNTGSAFMKSDILESCSTEELWKLHEQVRSKLARKIEQEKARLEDHLRRIASSIGDSTTGPTRRAYPKVLPKYQNTENSAETWSGRGKQPRWIQAQINAGKKLEHFLIDRSKIERRRRAS
jgi:DNA-binding protein H-NS